MLSDKQLLDWIEENAEAIASLCARTPPGTPVPSCPGWTLGHLLKHVAPSLAGWYTTNLSAERESFDVLASLASGPRLPSDRAGRVEHLRAGARTLRARACEVDLDAPVWAFGTTAPARYWLRRAATETAVHRWDAEQAGPGAAPIGSRRAAQSLDETLRGLWPALVGFDQADSMGLDNGFDLPTDPVGFRATDSGHAWRLDRSRGGIDARATDELPGTVVEGTGDDLVLYVWGRLPVDRLRVSGSRELVESWHILRRCGRA